MSGGHAEARGKWLFAHALVQVFVAGLSLVRARDPDLGFHLATGRAVLALGRVPATNVLSFAEPQAEAINQQWLPAVLFELAYQRLGIAGPTLLKWLVLASTFAVVLDTCRRLGARASVSLFAVSLAAWASSSRFVERPLVFSNLCVVLVAWCVAHRFAQREHAEVARWPFVVATLASAIAVHLHAGSVFAFVLLVAVAVASAFSAVPVLRRLAPEAPRAAVRDALGWLAAAVVAFAAAGLTLALYHPHGLRVLTVPFTMATDPFLYRVLVEFRPPWAFPFDALAPYWVFCVLATVAMLASIGRRSPVVLVMMAFGIALSLRHARFVDLAGLLAAPGFALIVDRAATRERFDVLAYALAACCVLGGLVTVGSAGSWGFGYEAGLWPVELMRDVRKLGLAGPAFVQDGWAGPYLAFRYPHERVFFHPAFDCYTPRFFREDYMRTRDGEPGWDHTLDRRGVDLVLMKYTSPNERRRQGNRPNLRQRLASDARWALVSFDAYGLVYVRRTRLGTERARSAVMNALDPDRGVFLAPPARALVGLENLAARGMVSPRQEALTALAREHAR